MSDLNIKHEYVEYDDSTIKNEYAMLDVAKLSDKELMELIKKAMTEFQHRLDSPTFVKKPAQKMAVAFVPPASKIAFIEKCLEKDYVHASMKDEYKALAKEYEGWFRDKGYPYDLRGSEGMLWKEYSL